MALDMICDNCEYWQWMQEFTRRPIINEPYYVRYDTSGFRCIENYCPNRKGECKYFKAK